MLRSLVGDSAGVHVYCRSRSLKISVYNARVSRGVGWPCPPVRARMRSARIRITVLSVRSAHRTRRRILR